MAGTLYVVSTPIGNLEDITHRALRVLREVEVIAAEDTRRTRILLDNYRIERPLISFYEHNEAQKAPVLIRKLEEGANVAIVSEAGTPLISDPGYRLVQLAIARGITIVPIPGPSAVIAALIISGLPAGRFVFEGFLPKKAGKRRSRLEELRDEERTLIFYESPRRISKLLKEMLETLGNRHVAVARELTKKFEEVLRGTIAEVLAHFAERPPLGEVTIVVDGAREKASRELAAQGRSCSISATSLA